MINFNLHSTLKVYDQQDSKASSFIYRCLRLNHKSQVSWSTPYIIVWWIKRQQRFTSPNSLLFLQPNMLSVAPSLRTHSDQKVPPEKKNLFLLQEILLFVQTHKFLIERIFRISWSFGSEMNGRSSHETESSWKNILFGRNINRSWSVLSENINKIREISRKICLHMNFLNEKGISLKWMSSNELLAQTNPKAKKNY